MRNRTPEHEIASAYCMDVIELSWLLTHWGLDHLSGRGKVSVTVVKEWRSN